MSIEPASRWRAAAFGLAIAAVLALAPPAVAACSVETIAELPLRESAGFLTVAASVAGEPVSFLLDTGAEAGLVTPEAAERLRLPLDPRTQTRMEGTGGLGAVAPHVVLSGVVLGRIGLPPRSVPVGPLPAIPRIVPPVVGLLGADSLAGADVEIDVARNRLLLHQVFGDCADPVSWPHTTVPLRREGDRLVARALLDGQPFDALLDTGALSIVVDTAAAAVVGVTPEMLAREPGGVSGGVDMRELPFHWHRFRSLAVGDVVIHKPVLTVTPVQASTPILLGAQWFAPRRVWLSYATSRMFVAR